MQEQILEKVIEAAAKIFKKSKDELNGNTKFTEDLGAKSVNIVQIIAELEDEYDIEIPFMPFRRNKTLAEAAAYVAELYER